MGADTPTGRRRLRGGRRPPGQRRLPGLTESLVLLFAFGMMAVGGLGGATGATFSGQAGNPANTWATFSVAPPGTISPVQSGSNVNVSWGASSNASSYLVQAGLSDGSGATATCNSVTWSNLSAADVTTSYADTGRVTASQGSYYCYTVTSNDTSGWTSVNNPTDAFSVGLFPTSWSWANAVSTLTADCGAGYGSSWGKAGALDCGDTITVTFSAPVDQTLFTTANSSVCVFKSGTGTVLLGDTTAVGATNCAAGDAYTMGQITGSVTGAFNNNYKFPLYAVTWSGNQVILTLGKGSGTAPTEKNGISWTLTPSASLAAPSGGQGQVGCTVAACQVTISTKS